MNRCQNLYQICNSDLHQVHNKKFQNTNRLVASCKSRHIRETFGLSIVISNQVSLQINSWHICLKNHTKLCTFQQ